MPFAWMLGGWHGNGKGAYPTIEAFDYVQDVIFAHDGRPFLHYFFGGGTPQAYRGR